MEHSPTAVYDIKTHHINTSEQQSVSFIAGGDSDGSDDMEEDLTTDQNSNSQYKDFRKHTNIG